MTDMSAAIVVKSDQLNGDDLIAGPITVRITRVAVSAREDQPVAIHYEDDAGKPYKPCKSMCRVMVYVWGLDHSKYVGKSMTLYREPSVKWGGLEVGGIRISHMSDMGDAKRSMPLTVTRGAKKLFTVQPLERKPAATPAGAEQLAAPPPAKREALGAEPPATDSASPPASFLPDAGEGAGASAPDAPAFLFTLVDSKGAVRTTDDGAQWRDALLGLIEKKPFDQATRVWSNNKDHVEAAFQAGHADYAIKVQAAWVKRERAASDTARGG